MHSKALFQCNTTKWKTNNTNHNNCSYNLAFCDLLFQNPSYLALPPKQKSLLRFTDVNINKLLIISSIPITFLSPSPAVIVQLLMLNIKLYILLKSIPWFILYPYCFLSWCRLKLCTKRGTLQTAHLAYLCLTILLASNFPTSNFHSPVTSYCKWKALQMKATDNCCCLPKAHQSWVWTRIMVLGSSNYNKRPLYLHFPPEISLWPKIIPTLQQMPGSQTTVNTAFYLFFSCVFQIRRQKGKGCRGSIKGYQNRM